VRVRSLRAGLPPAVSGSSPTLNDHELLGRGIIMPVTITIPTPLRQFAAGESEIQVEAQTAGEALAQLPTTHSELRRHLFNDQNALRNFVNVYVNDEDIR